VAGRWSVKTEGAEPTTCRPGRRRGLCGPEDATAVSVVTAGARAACSGTPLRTPSACSTPGSVVIGGQLSPRGTS